MNIKALVWQSRVRGLTVIEHDILYRFTVYAGKKDNFAFPSLGKITRQLETTRRHVERTARSIETKGFVKSHKEWDGRRRTTNRYEFKFNRLFPVGDGEKKGLVILKKIKEYLQNKSTGRKDERPFHEREWTSDTDRFLLGGFKFAWLDERRRRLWIAVESHSHMKYFLDHIAGIEQEVIGYTTTAKGKKRPLLRIEFTELYVTDDE